MKQLPSRTLVLGISLLFVFSVLSMLSGAAEQSDEQLCDEGVTAHGEGFGDLTGIDTEDLFNQSGIVVNEEPLDALENTTSGKFTVNFTNPGKSIIGRDNDGDDSPQFLERFPGPELKEEIPKGVSRNKKVLTAVGDGFTKKFMVPVVREAPHLKETLPQAVQVPGETILTGIKDRLNGILERNPLRNEKQKPVQYGLNDMQVAAVASTGAIFLLGAVLTGSSSAKTTAYLAPLVPLYSRIKKEKVFEHERRQHLYQLVGSYPGVSFKHLKQMMELENGTLRHHLSTLEREHYIKSIKDGKKRRFYLNGRKVNPLSRTQQHILHYIRQNPNISQSEIAHLMKVSRQNVNYHIKKMEKQHILRVRQDDSTMSYEIFERRW